MSGAPLAVRDFITEAGTIHKARKALELAEEMDVTNVAELCRLSLPTHISGLYGVVARTAEHLRCKNGQGRSRSKKRRF